MTDMVKCRKCPVPWIFVRADDYDRYGQQCYDCWLAEQERNNPPPDGVFRLWRNKRER